MSTIQVTVQRTSRPYNGVRVGGRDVGGMFDLHHPMTPPGTRPHIGELIKVESVDAICEKVVSLGGSTRPAFDVADQGRMAVCTDPNGSSFDIWEPKTLHGTDVDSTLHGAPSRCEAMTTDVVRASAFYCELLGWTAEAMPGWEYTRFRLGNDLVAGMMRIRPEMAGMRPHWAIYYTVNDIDGAALEAAKLGGDVHVKPRDIPGIGRFCGITSPQGVKFYVIQYLW